MRYWHFPDGERMVLLYKIPTDQSTSELVSYACTSSGQWHEVRSGNTSWPPEYINVMSQLDKAHESLEAILMQRGLADDSDVNELLRHRMGEAHYDHFVD